MWTYPAFCWCCLTWNHIGKGYKAVECQFSRTAKRRFCLEQSSSEIFWRTVRLRQKSNGKSAFLVYGDSYRTGRRRLRPLGRKAWQEQHHPYDFWPYRYWVSQEKSHLAILYYNRAEGYGEPSSISFMASAVLSGLAFINLILPAQFPDPVMVVANTGKGNKKGYGTMPFR